MEKRLKAIFRNFMQLFGLGELRTRVKEGQLFDYRELDLRKVGQPEGEDHRGFIAISKGYEHRTDLELWIMLDDKASDVRTVLRIQDDGTLYLGLDQLPQELKNGLGPLLHIRRQILVDYIRST